MGRTTTHRRPPRRCRSDPLGALADAAGYDDAERWWDDVVESRLDGSSPFPALTEAMAELRVAWPEPPASAVVEARREAYMRKTIRAAVKAGGERVAVVCGAWHAPVLSWPLPPASRGHAHPARPAQAQDHHRPGCRGRISGWRTPPGTARASPRPAGTTTSGLRRTSRSSAG